MNPSVTQLGYVVFEVTDLDAWDVLAQRILGLTPTESPCGSARGYRMDSHDARLFVQQGDADDLLAMGWLAADQEAMEEIASRLQDAGTDIIKGSEEEARDRRVGHLIKFVDPAGIPSEIACHPIRQDAPLSTEFVRQGFIGGDQGLGHLVISARTQEESDAFYRELLGFRLSDRIVCDLFGYAVDILFFHVNPRHHTLAFGGPQPKRLHHFMIEMNSLDDVGAAYDRAIRAGIPIMQTLGRHPNDQMVSFYAKTPSGFQFECGWGGRQIEDDTWETTTYDRISDWGHHHPKAMAPRRPKKEGER